MKIHITLALAVAGYAMTVPYSFAQQPSSPAHTGSQTPTSQHDNTGASSGSSPSQYPNGARKQPTQGLPSSLTPNSGARWNNQTPPAKQE